jgi:hypothetical protein
MNPEICVSRTTYHLHDWTSHAWSQSPPDLDLFTMFGGEMGESADFRSRHVGRGDSSSGEL